MRRSFPERTLSPPSAARATINLYVTAPNTVFAQHRARHLLFSLTIFRLLSQRKEYKVVPGEDTKVYFGAYGTNQAKVIPSASVFCGRWSHFIPLVSYPSERSLSRTPLPLEKTSRSPSPTITINLRLLRWIFVWRPVTLSNCIPLISYASATRPFPAKTLSSTSTAPVTTNLYVFPKI